MFMHKLLIVLAITHPMDAFSNMRAVVWMPPRSAEGAAKSPDVLPLPPGKHASSLRSWLFTPELQ